MFEFINHNDKLYHIVVKENKKLVGMFYQARPEMKRSKYEWVYEKTVEGYIPQNQLEEILNKLKELNGLMGKI